MFHHLPDWQIDNGFSKKTNHGTYSNLGTQVGGLQQGFQCCFADGFNKSLVLSVVQANVSLHTSGKCSRPLSLHPEFKKYIIKNRMFSQRA